MTDNTPAPTNGLVLGNKTYDRAKFIVQVFLPALGVLYATIAATFGLGGIEQVLAVLAAIGLFLGTIMRISSNNFTPATTTPDGAFVVTTLPGGKKSVVLEFEQDPETLVNGRTLSFEVKETNPVEDEPDQDREGNVP